MRAISTKVAGESIRKRHQILISPLNEWQRQMCKKPRKACREYQVWQDPCTLARRGSPKKFKLNFKLHSKNRAYAEKVQKRNTRLLMGTRFNLSRGMCDRKLGEPIYTRSDRRFLQSIKKPKWRIDACHVAFVPRWVLCCACISHYFLGYKKMQEDKRPLLSGPRFLGFVKMIFCMQLYVLFFYV